jgi:hypothetical protein
VVVQRKTGIVAPWLVDNLFPHSINDPAGQILPFWFRLQIACMAPCFRVLFP